jgi:uncharacterized OB-fold protein/acyl dehydratase
MTAGGSNSDGELTDQLLSFVGGEPEDGTVGLDEVNAPMIRHWCEAMGDSNPVYTDEDAAREAGHAGLVAPPTMLQVWTMRGLTPAATAPTAPAAQATAASKVLRLLDEAGFTSVVATNCGQTYARYLRPGDRLRDRVSVESVSGLKTTALGVGHFVTTQREYLDQQGECVGTMRFRLLKFRPADATATATAPAQRPAFVTTADTDFFFTGLSRGVVLAQQCSSCGRYRHPPAPSCPHCGSDDFQTVQLPGRGHVYSYVVVHHPQSPGFDYPLVVALVELDEGIRVVTELIGAQPAAVRIGLPVQLQPVAADDERLPGFRLVEH